MAANEQSPPSPEHWRARYQAVRGQTEAICAPLAIEDYVVQTRTEVSPPKWHLAHTSWFFEQFLLKPFVTRYKPFHPAFESLFNSYYQTVGVPYPRPQRGWLSRPTVEEVYRYRAFVDAAMDDLISGMDTSLQEEIQLRIDLGLHHEQQHQELLLMDIKHNFAANPLRPAYSIPKEPCETDSQLAWVAFEGGIDQVGAPQSGFAFDNERPRHSVLLGEFALASRLVTNREYMAFMDDGGYARPELWLSDGWTMRELENWRSPHYWRREGDEWMEMTLSGERPLYGDEPVCHMSYFEADAYARWAGKRLPREEEWEHAAQKVPLEGNLLESGILHPTPADGTALSQLVGDLWEWTATPYAAYPGYRRANGPFGEYNGKFMCNQMVLRGGACITPASHLRITYRNFFFPSDRWQFAGIRLAEDI